VAVVVVLTHNQSICRCTGGGGGEGHIRLCLCVQLTDAQHKCQVKGIASKCQCVSVPMYVCANVCLCQCVSVLQTCSSDVRELIAAVDRKSTGYISYDDFEAVMARSLLQHTRPVEAAVDLSATIRLQPDSSALPFHEVPITFTNALDLLLPNFCFDFHTAVLLHARHRIACCIMFPLIAAAVCHIYAFWVHWLAL